MAELGLWHLIALFRQGAYDTPAPKLCAHLCPYLFNFCTQAIKQWS